MKNNFQKILILVIIIFSIILISKFNIFKQNSSHFKFEKAYVENINEENIEKDQVIEDLYLGYQQIQIKITTGKYKGETFNIKNPMNRLYNIHTKVGDKIIVSIEEEENNIKSISVYNHEKEKVVYILVGAFFVLLVILSGWQGAKAVLSLIFTGIMIVFFM